MVSSTDCDCVDEELSLCQAHLIAGYTVVYYDRYRTVRATHSTFLFCGVKDGITNHILYDYEALSNTRQILEIDLIEEFWFIEEDENHLELLQF